MKQKTRASRYSAKDHYSAAEGCVVTVSAPPQQQQQQKKHNDKKLEECISKIMYEQSYNNDK